MRYVELDRGTQVTTKAWPCAFTGFALLSFEVTMVYHSLVASCKAKSSASTTGTSLAPAPTLSKQAERRALVKASTVKFVFMDWICLPQGKRTPAEEQYFKNTLAVMLPNLVLGVKVIGDL